MLHGHDKIGLFDMLLQEGLGDMSIKRYAGASPHHLRKVVSWLTEGCLQPRRAYGYVQSASSQSLSQICFSERAPAYVPLADHKDGFDLFRKLLALNEPFQSSLVTQPRDPLR